MKTINYSISPKVFSKCPGYIRGLVIATGLQNSDQSPTVEKLLREAEAQVLRDYTSESLLASPNVTAWRDSLRAFGINPGEFRPAHEALSRRAVQGKPLPLINAAVAIGNALSLKYLTPVGVHPLDEVRANLSLRLADGSENFVAFGSDKLESPKLGEPIFAEGQTVLARGWVWRQAKCSITLPATRSVVVHVDVLPPMGLADAERIAADVEHFLKDYCGATCRTVFLSATEGAAEIMHAGTTE